MGKQEYKGWVRKQRTFWLSWLVRRPAPHHDPAMTMMAIPVARTALRILTAAGTGGFDILNRLFG